MNIPGTNGPDRLQGGLPGFQITNWANLGNTNTGNPFQFSDKTYSASVNLQKVHGSHVFRGGVELLDQQINHFQPQGGAFQTVRGTFRFSGQSTMLQDAAAPSDARFNSWAAFLLGLPSEAGKVDQLVNPNSIYMKTLLLVRPGHVADQPRRDAGPRGALGAPGVADPARRQGRQPVRSRGRVRLHRRPGRCAAGHRRERRQRQAAAARRAHLPLRRQDGVPRRLCDVGGSVELHQLPRLVPHRVHLGHARHPAQRGRQPVHPGHHAAAGPHRTGRRARHQRGPHSAAPGRGHEHLRGGGGARKRPLLQRHRPARDHPVAHRAGRAMSARGPSGR